MKRAALLVALVACAHEPRQRVEFKEPMVIVAGDAERDLRLGDEKREEFRAVRVDPARMDQKTLASVIEQKSQLLLAAERHYRDAIERGDAAVATAAGVRIGGLYERMHDELVDAPRPLELSDEQRRLYDDELQKRLRTLLEKAVSAYDETVALAERTGASSTAVDEARASRERLRAVLVGVGEN